MSRSRKGRATEHRRATVVFAATLMLLAADSRAQNVAYVGSLEIGYSDASNTIGFPINAAIPACAGGGPLVNPGTIGTLAGSLRVTALGTAGAGPGSPLTFHAVGGSHGGAQQKRTQTCRTTEDVGNLAALRSQTVVGSANWPARKGPYSSMIDSAPVPMTPNATYMLGASGGNTHPTSVASWTTRPSSSAAPVVHTGAAFSRVVWNETESPPASPSLPRARLRVQPGTARFGGGAPFSGKAGVSVGLNYAWWTPAATSDPPYGNYPYATGPLSYRPSQIGTKAQGTDIVSLTPVRAGLLGSLGDVGLLAGRQDLSWKLRTPGGSTVDQIGAIATLGGGNTRTPSGTIVTPTSLMTIDCVVAGCPEIGAPYAISGAYMPWTTGDVTATNRGGSFSSTVRRAGGYDIAVNPTSAVMGETRRIQLVSPWTASSRKLPGGSIFQHVARTVAGVAVLTLNVIPIGQLEDFDADLVPVGFDNCETIQNGPNDGSHQIDTDHDGYGNACDGDYTGDHLTTTADFTHFIGDFVEGRVAQETDHGGDGLTTTSDFPVYVGAFQGVLPLGPGLPCAGVTLPCLPAAP